MTPRSTTSAATTTGTTTAAAAECVSQAQMLGRCLGAELRSARQARGWPRSRMLRRLQVQTGQELCEQTLRSYEIGSRQMPVQRLIEVCAVLGVRAEVILGAALRQTFSGPVPAQGSDTEVVSIHLPTLLTSRTPHLAALRNWAHLAREQSHGERIELNRAALAHLAALAGVDSTTLRATLFALNPDTSESHDAGCTFETLGGNDE